MSRGRKDANFWPYIIRDIFAQVHKETHKRLFYLWLFVMVGELDPTRHSSLEYSIPVMSNEVDIHIAL